MIIRIFKLTLSFFFFTSLCLAADMGEVETVTNTHDSQFPYHVDYILDIDNLSSDVHTSGTVSGSTVSGIVGDFQYLENSRNGAVTVRDDLAVIGTAQIGDGGTTNYTQILADGDQVFVGTAGLPFGCIEGEDETVVCTTQNIYYKVTFDTIGQSNLTTVSADNNEIIILKAGVYIINVTACFHSAVSSDFELLVQKDADPDTDPEIVVGNHLFQTTAVSNKVENTAGSCQFALEADDIIHLWVRCTSAGGRSAIFNHVNMHCTMVGGG